jgi:hypothetical protein
MNVGSAVEAGAGDAGSWAAATAVAAAIANEVAAKMVPSCVNLMVPVFRAPSTGLPSTGN